MKINKKLQKDLKNSFKTFIPFAIVITAFCGLVYTAVQQNYRMNANDPQIQISEDIASQLSSGQNPLYYVPPNKVDMAKSLSPFLMLFDSKGKLIGSSVTLNGKTPNLPQGVFVSTKNLGETRFTWQPQLGVRSALVVSYYKSPSSDGYVTVGRSIKEIEIREQNLELMAFATWIITLVATFLYIFLTNNLKFFSKA